MYRGFKIDPRIDFDLPRAESNEQTIINEAQTKFYSALRHRSGGAIDGRTVANEWFPEIKADVFISYAHADCHIAENLAAWLTREFNLDVFVDVNVWGQSDELLWDIDRTHCKHGTAPGCFDYKKRNRSASYIHMLLATALAKLIDRTECFIFLETDNSITAESTIKDSHTYSPWLYYELALSTLLAKPLSHHKHDSKTRTFSMNENVNFFRLPAQSGHLTDLTAYDLGKWQDMKKLQEEKHALDLLYQLKEA